MSGEVVVLRDRPVVQAEENSTVVVAQKVTQVVTVLPVRQVVLNQDPRPTVNVLDQRQTVVVVRQPNITINVSGNYALEYHGSPIDIVNGLFGQPLRDTLHDIWWKCTSNPSGTDWAPD